VSTGICSVSYHEHQLLYACVLPKFCSFRVLETTHTLSQLSEKNFMKFIARSISLCELLEEV
jgi:hypothetical protein